MCIERSQLKRAIGAAISASAAVLLLMQSGAFQSGAFASRAHAHAAATQPVGSVPPSETLLAAEQVATRWVRNAHVDGEVVASIAETSFAKAQAVIQNKAPDEAETGGAPSVAEWHAEAVYLAVLTARDGSSFDPPEPAPRGSEPVGGTVADLLISVNTSEIVGEALWSAAPSLAQLGPVMQSVIPSSTAAAATLRVPHGDLTVLEGTVYKGAQPVTGWHVLLGKPHTDLLEHATRVGRTFVKGFFSFTLLPGNYQIGVKTANGRLCATRAVTVRPHTEPRLTLRCK